MSTITSIVAGRPIQSRDVVDVINPYTNTVTARMKRATGIKISPFKRDSALAVKRSTTLGARAWRSTLSHQNTQHMILSQVTAETGSPIRYHSEDLKGTMEYLKHVELSDAGRDPRFSYGPKGNVLIVLCANEPISVTTILAFTALWAGNTIYLKPSSKTPSFAHALVRALSQVPGLTSRVHLLLIDRQETERLILSRAFDAVLSFGGSATSSAIAQLCAQVSVEFIEESEGCDWAYIDKSAKNIPEVLRLLVTASTRHNGQMCNAIRGVMVHTSHWKTVQSLMPQLYATLVEGDPHHFSTDLGALISGTERHATQLLAQLPSSKILMKSDHPPRACVSYTAKDTTLMHIPVFAPIIWLAPVRSDEEAQEMHNTHNAFGLSFSLFATLPRVINNLSTQIDAGRIHINSDPLHIGPFDPMGGIRISGRGGPKYWIEKLSNRKYISRA